MKKYNRKIELPEAGKPNIYERIKETLTVASQLIIASPLKLPPKVVMVAKYLTLTLGILEAVERNNKKGGAHEDDTP